MIMVSIQIQALSYPFLTVQQRNRIQFFKFLICGTGVDGVLPVGGLTMTGPGFIPSIGPVPLPPVTGPGFMPSMGVGLGMGPSTMGPGGQPAASSGQTIGRRVGEGMVRVAMVGIIGRPVKEEVAIIEVGVGFGYPRMKGRIVTVPSGRSRPAKWRGNE